MIIIKKVLVSIYVLKLDRTFDVELPINLPMVDALDLIQNAIMDMTGNAYQPYSDVKLYESVTGNLVNLSNIVKYSGIKNGCKLLLV